MNLEQLKEEIYEAVNGLPSETDDKLTTILTQAHQAGIDDAVEKLKQNTVGKWQENKISRKDFEEALSALTKDHTKQAE